MKLTFYITILTSVLAISSCSVYAPKSPQRTSSARAAYGNGVPDFNAHKKKNQKRKRQARNAAKRKKEDNNKSYWHQRPY